MAEMENKFVTPITVRTKKLKAEQNSKVNEFILPSPSLSEKNRSCKTPIPGPLKKLKSSKEFQTPKHMIIPPSPCMKKLGYGTGVNVYLIERFSPSIGTYKSPWAVKKINKSIKINPEFKTRLEEEAKILKTLKHPNIIGYRSAVREEDGDICLVMESGQKSLLDLIELQLDTEQGPFPNDSILKVAKSLASALHYLHEECHLIHGDLKSANVLIKGDFDAIKICDFGVALQLNDKLEIKNPDEFYIGTECWAAPEVLKCEKISNKTDIFSYGLVLWEMISLNPPHQDKLNIDSFELENTDEAALETLEAELEEEYQKALGTRPPLPDLSLDDSYNKVLEIFYLCTHENPAQRPSAKQILEGFFIDDKL